MSDLPPAARYRLAPDVVSETFADGESVVVNLESGYYFSLNPVGGLMFELIGRGGSVDEVGVTVAAAYDTDARAIRAEAERFAARLVEEGLVLAGPPEDPPAPALPPPSVPAASANGRAPFEAPTITAYTDMQDLLLADPIHDYDETGWPARVDES